MKICIAGKNDIAVLILEYLLEIKKIPNNDLIVCCNKNESGKNTWQRSLRFAANKYKIKEVNLEDIYDIEDLVFISLEFDRIIKPSKFKSHKLFNIHFSLLPAYKGMYTSALPILNNEKYVGVTFHKIDSGIDTGDIISQKKFLLNYDDTARDLYLNNIKYGILLVKECIDKFLPMEFNCYSVSQDFSKSTYNSRNAIDYTNIRIDLNQTALNIHNQIRAFVFREYQMPEVFGKKIIYAKPLSVRSTKKAGTVIFENEYQMVLNTIDYDVVLYFDKFEVLVNACKNNDIQDISKIPLLHLYLNQKEEHGWTLLMIATYNGFYKLAMMLVAEGADIFACNNNGTNLLMYAKDAFVKTGDARLFDYFLSKGVNPLDKDFNGFDLFDYCKRENISKIGDLSLHDKKFMEGGEYNRRIITKLPLPMSKAEVAA